MGGALPAGSANGISVRVEKNLRGRPSPSTASANDGSICSRAGGACCRVFQGDDLSLLACRTLRLPSGDSSISVRMATRSSVAEITGKSITSRHAKARTHCRELNWWSARALPDLRHSQQAGRASSNHARLSSSSIADAKSGKPSSSASSVPETANRSQCDLGVKAKTSSAGPGILIWRRRANCGRVEYRGPRLRNFPRWLV